MGSVKDLKIIKKPAGTKEGEGIFIFSDRYSVFDWGTMPDLIPRKGEALAVLAAYFFERFSSEGVKTHYMGMEDSGDYKPLNKISKPSSKMKVKLLNVIKPRSENGAYDYSNYKNIRGCFLIPLEIIYRNVLPEGSSVFKRIKEGKITPEDIGLKDEPEPGAELDEPLIDVSTKLEVTDRYINWQEASDISGLSEEEIKRVKSSALSLSEIITEEASRVGLVNEDGKFEFGMNSSRELMVVDVAGTLDECRFTSGGLPVSKEIARIYYRNTPWHEAVEKAKREDRENWREICDVEPEPLPEKLKKAISDVYCACANEITGRKWFNAPELQRVLGDIRDLAG
jgi:phosphoribosylaminoimidazole-succinocarboxamide synthase